MIFYFSATGNSRHVAKRLAEANGDKLYEIGRGENSPFTIANGEPVGFVMPTYYWGVPKVVLQFLSQIQLPGKHYCYLVLTCGGSTSRAATIFTRAFHSRFSPDNGVAAYYSVKMPDTYTPMFDIPNAEQAAQIVRDAEPSINEIAHHVRNRAVGDFDQLHGKRILTSVCYPVYKCVTTRRFHVSDACVGCGLCERDCPSHAIKLVDSKPRWVERKCCHCLRCLHSCPQFAIQYGKNTQKRGQYTNPALL